MAAKAGEGFVDLIPKLEQNWANKVNSALVSPLGKAGAAGGESFTKAFSNKVSASLKSLGGGTGGLAGLLGPIGIGGALVAGVVGGILKVADATAKYAGDVRALKASTGASAEDASRLIAMFHALGVATDSLSRPILTLSQSLATGGGKLKDFFSSDEITRFQHQDLSKTILDIGDRFKSIQDPIKKNELLVDAFGKRGAALRPIFAASREELEKFAAHAEKVGLVFNDQQLDNARKYQIAVRELGDTFKGLEVTVGNAVIPTLTKLAGFFDDFIQNATDANGPTQRFLGLINTLGTDVGPVGDRVQNFSDKLFGVDPNSEKAKRLRDFSNGIIDTGKAADEASGNVDVLHQSLDQLTVSAQDDENAAKILAKAYDAAFKDIETAAAAFDKQLDTLIPKLGQVFKPVSIEGFVAGPDQAKNARAVADAQDTLAQAEAHLADIRKKNTTTFQDVAHAERAVADARQAVVDATEKASSGTGNYVTALEKDIRTNAAAATSFANDLTTIRDKLASSTVEGGEAVKQSFLAHLAELGPGAVPLLDQLATTTGAKLGELATVFGGQVEAAKRAADFQFDKYPANFAQKVGLARQSAVAEGQKMIAEFNALPEGSNLAEAMGDQIAGLALKIESVLGPVLTEAQKGFLHTAETAGTSAERVQGLQSFIDSLHSKTVDVDVNVESALTHLDEVLGKLSQLSGVEATLALIQPGGSPLLPGGHVPTAHRLEDGSIAYFARGGDPRTGQYAWVGEEGPELVRFGPNSHVIPNNKIAGGGDHFHFHGGVFVGTDERAVGEFMGRALHAAQKSGGRR